MAIINDDDRRKYSRVGFSTEIKIDLKTKDQERLEGNSKDLSQKGLFVTTDQRFTLGTLCSVIIYLTGSMEKIELSIEGTIVRETDTGIGIVFNSMDVDTYSHLKNIVHYNSVDVP